MNVERCTKNVGVLGKDRVTEVVEAAEFSMGLGSFGLLLGRFVRTMTTAVTNFPQLEGRIGHDFDEFESPSFGEFQFSMSFGIIVLEGGPLGRDFSSNKMIPADRSLLLDQFAIWAIGVAPGEALRKVGGNIFEEGAEANADNGKKSFIEEGPKGIRDFSE